MTVIHVFKKIIKYFVFLSLFFSVNSFAEDYIFLKDCKHNYSNDGDTSSFSCKRGDIKIRYECIDAPEYKINRPNGSQEHGKESYRAINYLINSADTFQVIVATNSKGKPKKTYDRFVGDVLLGKDMDRLSAIQVFLGNAWVYKKYCKNSNYSLLQKKAKLKKEGLWKDNNPIPPWEFRKQHK